MMPCPCLAAKRSLLTPNGSALGKHPGVERPSTSDIHIHVDAAIVIHDEVLEGVDALNWVAVVVVRGQEPAVVVFEEFSRGGGVPDIDGERRIVLDA